jgi:hypothetical protein
MPMPSFADAVGRRGRRRAALDLAGRQFRGRHGNHKSVTTVVTPAPAYTTEIETFEVQVNGRPVARVG